MPREERTQWSPQQFIRHLPAVANDIAKVRFSPKAPIILTKYATKLAGGTTSFDAIAEELGISKQAAQQLFNKVLRRLRRLLVQGNNRGCSVYVRPEFLLPLRKLSRALGMGEVMSLKDWNARVLRTWEIKISDLPVNEALLLEILGFRRFVFDSPEVKPIIVSARNKSKTRLEGAATFIRKLLSSRPTGLTLPRMIAELERQSKSPELSSDAIRVLLTSMPNIKKHGSKYLLRSHPVKGRADHYFQILKAAGKPLHYRELGRRARRFGFSGSTQRAESVTYFLRHDKRFVRVAQSGCWALAEWSDVETRTVSEIAYDEIKKAGGPLHERALYSLIQRKRTVQPASIGRMLKLYRSFRKVGPRIWSIDEVK